MFKNRFFRGNRQQSKRSIQVLSHLKISSFCSLSTCRNESSDIFIRCGPILKKNLNQLLSFKPMFASTSRQVQSKICRVVFSTCITRVWRAAKSTNHNKFLLKKRQAAPSLTAYSESPSDLQLNLYVWKTERKTALKARKFNIMLTKLIKFNKSYYKNNKRKNKITKI